MGVLFVALPEESTGLGPDAAVLHTGAGKVQAAAAVAHRLANCCRRGRDRLAA